MYAISCLSIMYTYLHVVELKYAINTQLVSIHIMLFIDYYLLVVPKRLKVDRDKQHLLDSVAVPQNTLHVVPIYYM
jgi:hypothetical protein